MSKIDNYKIDILCWKRSSNFVRSRQTREKSNLLIQRSQIRDAYDDRLFTSADHYRGKNRPQSVLFFRCKKE